MSNVLDLGINLKLWLHLEVIDSNFISNILYFTLWRGPFKIMIRMRRVLYLYSKHEKEEFEFHYIIFVSDHENIKSVSNIFRGIFSY